MGGDTEDSAHSSPSVEPSISPVLHSALTNFSLQGQPKISELLAALHKEGIIEDTNLQTLIFIGLGGYSHYFSKHFNETGMPQESHIHAVGMVMKNPRMGLLVESMMSSAISAKISGVVN
tara:strand:+ start:5146 stop:5505 length:360 start_codon:yes stop_codon:yes gene_type:complete